MIWVIYALFLSMFRAAFAETSRIFKVDSLHLFYVHSLVALVILTPLTFFMAWPQDPRFYFAATLVSLILTAGTLQQLNLADQKIGRVSSVYMPVEAMAACLLWFAVGPQDMLDSYINDPILAGGLALAFLLCVGAILTIRESDISLRSLMVVAPVGCTFAVAAVVAKMVMPSDMVIPSALTFVFIHYVITTVTVGIYALLKGRITADIFSSKVLKAGSYAGIFAMLGYISFIAAIAYAPNPGFVSIVAMMVPVWLLAYHKTAAVKDNANWVSGLMMVLGIIILIYISGQQVSGL
jgi:hypothetical protein